VRNVLEARRAARQHRFVNRKRALAFVVVVAATSVSACNSGESCERYAGDAGACNNFVGYTWNGTQCVNQSGCLCEGNGCPGVYQDLSSCQNDHRMCASDAASDH
jgi:hypothetical protein